MQISKLISELTNKFDINEDVEREELEMFLSILLEKDKFCFRIGDIVKITKKYPDYLCTYIGRIGSFDYGKTEEGFGPTESIRLDKSMYISTNGIIEIIFSTAPSGKTEYATKEEVTEFLKALKDNGCIL